MDIQKLSLRLNKIQNILEEDNQIQSIVEKIKDNHLLDPDDKIKIKKEYYQTLPKYELLYQEKNDEYKELISQFSKAYLELCEFYVGPELPRETYLDSKQNMMELILLFIFFAMWEPYINAYYEKYCLPKNLIR
tara:strand:- start:825 stop:1226 length:402 start_codon:yes stop_codon:yes gene_type:complete